MRIGIQQTALGEASLVKSFAIAKRAKAEGVGLCYRTAEEARNLADPDHASKLIRLMEMFDITVTGLHLSVLCEEAALIGPADAVARSQELIRRAILTASSLGRVDVIVPFLGRNRIELPREYDTAAKAIVELAETAEDHGVVLAVNSSLHLSQLRQFLSECGSGFVKACPNTGEVAACRHDPATMVLGLGLANIAQIHLKDVRIIGGLPPDFGVSLGCGNVRFTRVASAVQSLGYDGWLVLETPPGDTRAAIAADQIAYTRKLFDIFQLPQRPHRGSDVGLAVEGVA